MTTFLPLRLPRLALSLSLAFSLAAVTTGSCPATPTFAADLPAIQTDWAKANYQPSGASKEASFDVLAKQAAALISRYAEDVASAA